MKVAREKEHITYKGTILNTMHFSSIPKGIEQYLQSTDKGEKTAHQNSIINKNILQKKKKEAADFPDCPVVKDGPANEGVTGSIPGPGKSHMLQGN